MTDKKKDITNNEMFDYMQQGFADMIDSFEKVDDRFDKLEKYTIKGFDRIDKALETKASSADLRKVMDTLDKILKQQEISDDERLVMQVQLTRIHDWVELAAKRIDLEFVK